MGGSAHSSTFSYGGDHLRKQQVATYSTGSETTLYVGGLMEVVTSSSTMFKHLVATPSGTQVVITRVLGGGTSVAYVSTDHLGSGDVISDAAGNVAALVRESFTAFGQRRGADWTLATAPDYTGISQTTRRGFTFHEHMDNLGLVHMNGRVYDPALGRFLSADPLLDGLQSPGGANAFAYVRNAPLTAIDPWGYAGERNPNCAPCTKPTDQDLPTLPPGATGTPGNPTNQGSVTVTNAGPGYSGVNVNTANGWGGLTIVSVGGTEISAGAIDEVVATATRVGSSRSSGPGIRPGGQQSTPDRRKCMAAAQPFINGISAFVGGGVSGFVSSGGNPYVAAIGAATGTLASAYADTMNSNMNSGAGNASAAAIVGIGGVASALATGNAGAGLQGLAAAAGQGFSSAIFPGDGNTAASKAFGYSVAAIGGGVIAGYSADVFASKFGGRGVLGSLGGLAGGAAAAVTFTVLIVIAEETICN